jgi:hypothetical protein
MASRPREQGVAEVMQTYDQVRSIPRLQPRQSKTGRPLSTSPPTKSDDVAAGSWIQTDLEKGGSVGGSPDLRGLRSLAFPATRCTRGWTDADMDAGFERLERRGLMTGDEVLTDASRAFGEEIEVRTDELERPVVEALGDDLDELLDHLDSWSEAVIDAGFYPPRVAGVYSLGGGPHMGVGLTIDTAAEIFGR